MLIYALTKKESLDLATELMCSDLTIENPYAMEWFEHHFLLVESNENYMFIPRTSEVAEIVQSTIDEYYSDVLDNVTFNTECDHIEIFHYLYTNLKKAELTIPIN